jgi:hypothetical protein
MTEKNENGKGAPNARKQSQRPGGAPPPKRADQLPFVLCRESRLVVTRRLGRGRFKSARAICRESGKHDGVLYALGAARGEDAFVFDGFHEIPVTLHRVGKVGLLCHLSGGENDYWDFGGGVLRFDNVLAVPLDGDMTDEELARELGLDLVDNVVPDLLDAWVHVTARGSCPWTMGSSVRWRVKNAPKPQRRRCRGDNLFTVESFDAAAAEIPLRLVTVAEDCREHYYFPCFLRRVDGSPYCLLLEVAETGPGTCGRWFPKGHRGTISVDQLGTSAFDFHHEVPVDGWGIPRSALVVVEREPDGTVIRTPYVRWCRDVGLQVTCGRCGADLLRDDVGPCNP